MRLGAGSLDRLLPLALWAVGLVYAMALLSPQGNSTPQYALVFNDMLVRLLHGRFDIDPGVIGAEAFQYKGHAYAYFGVFCALLRLPLLATGHIGSDFTAASMMLAAGVSLGARLAALNLAMRRATGLSTAFRLIVLGAAAFSGESVQYLHPSLFQEVVSWGAALASVFVWLATCRLFGPEGKAGRTYALMALVAGLALLCRVSFGLGLYAALGLMLCVEAWRSRAQLAGLSRLAPAALVLALFLTAAGTVNEARWDNPLSFVPLRYQTILHGLYPDREPRLERYGEFNLRRLPFALQYYFAPIWVLQDGQGRMWFQQQQVELFEDVELPPSTFFLSDPVVCILAGLGLWTLARRPGRLPDPALASAALAGLALPAALMLVAIILALRYRMEFYPVLDLAACIGLAGPSGEKM